MAVSCICLFALLCTRAVARGPFNKAPAEQDLQKRLVDQALSIVVMEAMADDSNATFDSVRIAVEDTYKAMPKNKFGFLDSSAVRYLSHTYFLKEYGWLVQGLEPHKKHSTEVSKMQREDIPSYVQAIFSQVAEGQGFDMGATVAYLVVIREIILKESISVLEKAYSLSGRNTQESVSLQDLEPILDSFVVLQADWSRYQSGRSSENLVQSPRFRDTMMLAQDVMQSYNYNLGSQRNPFKAHEWTFQEAYQVVRNVALQYGKVHDQECQALKDALVEMDRGATGRVSLGHFYARKKVNEWTLDEPVDRLRNLGLLDESAPSVGSRVIISNYITSVSNCEVHSSFYSLCCLHECEVFLNDLESKLQRPWATTDEIGSWVISTRSSMPGAPLNVSSVLSSALHDVAKLHEGKIPLHGRLFAQWLHYAFPHECPYPHLHTNNDVVQPSDWFSQSDMDGVVSEAEVQEHLRLIEAGSESGEGEVVSMSQWTLDEELRWGDHHDAAPHEAKLSMRWLGRVLPLLVMVGALVFVLGREMHRLFIMFNKVAPEKKIDDLV